MFLLGKAFNIPKNTNWILIIDKVINKSHIVANFTIIHPKKKFLPFFWFLFVLKKVFPKLRKLISKLAREIHQNLNRTKEILKE